MVPRGGMWDFFVSYSREDRAWAEWIAWALEANGYRVLIQAWDMVPGTNWVTTVNEGILRAERTIAVLSEAYLKSDWTQVEALGALRRDPLGRERRLLVVRIEKCSPEGMLGMIVRIDVFGRAEQDARQTLLDGVEQASRDRAKPSTPTAFPGTAHAARFPQGSTASPGERRMCLALDIEGYRGLAVDGREQVRGLVLAMLFTALGRAGVQNGACVVIDRVDGLAVILPAQVAGPSATAAVVRELCAGVTEIGRVGRGRSPVRTRVGVAAGDVDLTSPTFEGSAMAAARLLASSGQVRVATARSPRTPNAVIVGDDVYQTADSVGLPTGFTRIPVSADSSGWINLILGASAPVASPVSADREHVSVSGGAGGVTAMAAVGVAGEALAAEVWQHLLDYRDGLADAALGESAHGHRLGEYGGEPWQDPDPESAETSTSSEVVIEGSDAPSRWHDLQWDDPEIQGDNDVQNVDDAEHADHGIEFGDGLWGS